MDIIDLRKQDQLIYDHSREENPEPYVFMHAHTDMEIYYLIDGDVEYHVENSIYKPMPGDILIMRPGEVHTSLVTSPRAYDRFNLRFSPELLKETLNGRLLRPFLDRPAGVSNHYTAQELHSELIKSCFSRMFTRDTGRDPMRAVTYLLPILQEIYDAWSIRDIPKENPATTLPARIIAYINQNLSGLESPQQICDAFYMSQAQLYRVFRAYAGTSVWDYVRAKRLHAAREQMLSGVAPAQAALENGFSDYSTFFRAYKKEFEHTPKEDYENSKRS